jgi:SRSO17 transposase
MQVGNLGIIEINEVPPPLDLSPEEIAALAAELVDYHAAFADLYYRKEQAHWGLKYLQGLLLPIERKSIEPMALALDGGDVQAMQQFIGQGQWQDDLLLRQHWRLVDETLGEADGVYIVDGSDVPKQGEHSVGVARQWCGHVGKVDNCQAGMFAAYASRKGYTLLDRRLYLPEEWFDAAHRERWCKCGIPDATLFKTKQALALEMVQASVTEGGPRFRWLTCDEAFGRDGAFLDGIAALGRWYCAEVPHDTQVWLTRPATAVPTWRGRGRRPRKARLVTGEPAPQRVDQLAAAVPLDAWQPYLIKEGSKGPLVAEFAFQRGVAVRAGLPGPDGWLVFRRGLGENPELKVYLSNAPTHTPVAALVRVAGMRWPIETAFEESKGGLGLDHYEVRSWLGWHHHMTLCLLAHHFLVRARQRVKKGRQR